MPVITGVRPLHTKHGESWPKPRSCVRSCWRTALIARESVSVCEVMARTKLSPELSDIGLHIFGPAFVADEYIGVSSAFVGGELGTHPGKDIGFGHAALLFESFEHGLF